MLTSNSFKWFLISALITFSITAQASAPNEDLRDNEATAHHEHQKYLFKIMDLFPQDQQAQVEKRVLKKHKDIRPLKKAIKLLPSEKRFKTLMQAKNLSDIYSEIYLPDALYGRIQTCNHEDFVSQLKELISTITDEADDQKNIDAYYFGKFIESEQKRELQDPNLGLAIFLMNWTKNRRSIQIVVHQLFIKMESGNAKKAKKAAQEYIKLPEELGLEYSGDEMDDLNYRVAKQILDEGIESITQGSIKYNLSSSY